MRLFVIVFNLLVFGAFGAQNDALLKADSLFFRHQYTQAFDAYEALYENELVSSTMLLKMAFIQEAVGDYSEALYFLNQYYQLTADRTVIAKIEELASNKNLSGYQYTDGDYFLAMINKYRMPLLLSLAASLVLLTGYVFHKSRSGHRSYPAFVFQVILSTSLFLLINSAASSEGIVVMDQTLLKSGPSAAAEPVQVIQKGHKVRVIDQDPVWTKIFWEGDEVFVRNNRIRII